MNNKALCAVIGAMFLILLAISGWWVTRAESKFTIVDQLQWKDHYLNGDVKAAPVEKPVNPPPAAKK